jgi:hypothetical protein
MGFRTHWLKFKKGILLKEVCSGRQEPQPHSLTGIDKLIANDRRRKKISEVLGTPPWVAGSHH